MLTHAHYSPAVRTLAESVTVSGQLHIETISKKRRQRTIPKVVSNERAVFKETS